MINKWYKESSNYIYMKKETKEKSAITARKESNIKDKQKSKKYTKQVDTTDIEYYNTLKIN